MDSLHRCEVDHQSVVDGCASGHIMTPAANRDLETELTPELDGVDNVGHAAAAGNQRRTLVHEAIMDPSRLIVAGIAGLQQLPRERVGKFPRGVSNGSRGRS
jgi:hypothetical protein